MKVTTYLTVPTSFEEALARLQEWSEGEQEMGLGFVFTETDGLGVLVIDDCVEPDGTLAPLVRTWVDILDTYTEYDPSGKSILILCHTDLKGITDQKFGEFEARYIFSGGWAAMTGNRVPGTSSEIRAKVIEGPDGSPMFRVAPPAP